MGAWLLDTGVFVVFQRGGALELLATLTSQDRLLVIEETFDELTGRLRQPKLPDARAQTDAASAFLTAHAARVDVMLGSAADLRRQALREGRTSTRSDWGEDAAIAWAIGEPGVRFVTNDEKAVGRAVRELPGRVAMTHELLCHIVEIDVRTVERVATLAAAASAALVERVGWGSQLPLWWPEWIGKRQRPPSPG